MIEWEIDETYTECGNKRRMSGHMNKEMKGSFIYRNENRTYTSLDRGCSGFYPTTWNFIFQGQISTGPPNTLN